MVILLSGRLAEPSLPRHPGQGGGEDGDVYWPRGWSVAGRGKDSQSRFGPLDVGGQSCVPRLVPLLGPGPTVTKEDSWTRSRPRLRVCVVHRDHPPRTTLCPSPVPPAPVLLGVQWRRSSLDRDEDASNLPCLSGRTPPHTNCLGDPPVWGRLRCTAPSSPETPGGLDEVGPPSPGGAETGTLSFTP